MALTDDLVRLRRSAFVRSVAVLAGGTALSQMIMLTVLPILTRIYTPEDFSILAVYAAALNICSVAACLRFEIAIPIPNADEDAVSLLVLSLLSTLLTSSVLLIIVLGFPTSVASMLGKPELKGHLWLLPAGVALTGSYSALQNWSTRKKHFGAVSRTRMTQSLAGASTQVGCGLFGHIPAGLLFGQMLSVGAGVFGLAYSFLRKERRILRTLSWKCVWNTCHQYNKFPLYSALEALTNSAAIQIPLIVIAAYALGSEAGYLMLAMRIIQAPMGLIGNAISQVYMSEAQQKHRQGNLGMFTNKILEGLLKIGVGPLIFLAVIAPSLFSFVFGKDWGRAGQLVTWMMPWFVMQFLTSPISMALHVTRNQKLALFLQLFGLISRVGLVVASAFLFREWISEVYAFSGFLFYCIYFIVIMRVSSISALDIYAVCKRALAILLPWMAISVCALFL